jgi:hypothetical protein
MRRWRTRIRGLTPATLGLFLASLTVVRPGLFFHTHAGGDHFHIHDEEAGGLPTHEHHAPEHVHHAHHYEAANQASNLLAFETPDGDEALGHWHTQSPFHRVASVGLQSASHTEWVRPAPVPTHSDCIAAEVAASRARSPPLLAVS